jgi:hypothetical protein
MYWIQLTDPNNFPIIVNMATIVRMIPTLCSDHELVELWDVSGKAFHVKGTLAEIQNALKTFPAIKPPFIEQKLWDAMQAGD